MDTALTKTPYGYSLVYDKNSTVLQKVKEKYEEFNPRIKKVRSRKAKEDCYSVVIDFNLDKILTGEISEVRIKFPHYYLYPLLSIIKK